MPWFYLFLAGVFEIVWAIALKYSEGFSRALPTGIVFTAGFASFWLLGLAAQKLPIGTAYAVWTGIGAVGTAILGMILFAESHHAPRLASIALIVIGIAGLRLFGAR
ncbi:MAG TPA: multidrug efflux SMR transporter [Terriglobales bacterium]|nr:multidrug efflux SMR transporter [Terriglobales bacterium]